jgi:hypothetical protein
MDRFCVTRAIKNAKYLQKEAPDLVPKKEPADGFASLIPRDLLTKLHLAGPEATKIRVLSELLARRNVPRAGTRASAPLFSGSIQFVDVTFNASGRTFSVPPADLATAMRFSGLVAKPITRYAAQYGPNSVSVAGNAIPLSVNLVGNRYNDQTLAGWADQVAKQNGLSGDCLAFLNPQGVLNTDADASQGVLGYHGFSPGGAPYIFMNPTGSGFTLQDSQDFYALAVSHEIAEMVVDPRADGSNPEVCDGCGPNCETVLRDYFDGAGAYLKTSTAFPPPFGFGFYINAIVKPSSATACPAPDSACAYAPP